MPRAITFTPKTFATEWTRQFEQVVREAAGRDGRLTLAEAKRIAQRTDGGRFMSDNAVNYLFAKQQGSVNTDKLIAAAHDYALAKAIDAAGPDGKLSLADAAKLPLDLRDDFQSLRTGAVLGGADRSPEQLKLDVRDATLRAIGTGTAKKLALMPQAIHGAQALEVRVDDPANGAHYSTYAVAGHIYAQATTDTQSDLIGWYDVGPVPPALSNRGNLRDTLEATAAGVWFPSESDAPMRFVLGENVGTQPITEQLVREKLGTQHDALFDDIFGGAPRDIVPLADRQLESVQNVDAFFQHYIDAADPNDPDSLERAQRFDTIRTVMRAQLSDVKAYRFGTIDVSILIVGRTPSGDLAGYLTGSVET